MSPFFSPGLLEARSSIPDYHRLVSCTSNGIGSERVPGVFAILRTSPLTPEASEQWEELLDAMTDSQMKNRRAVSFIIWICIFVSMSLLQGTAPTLSSAQEELRGFVPLEPDQLRKLNKEARPEVKKSPVRSKAVIDIHHANFDARLLSSLRESKLRGEPISFQVSQSISVTVVTDRFEEDSNKTVEWSGQVRGDLNGSFDFIVRSGRALYGDIRVGGRLYEIRPIGSGFQHRILTLDLKKFPPDDPPSRRRLRPERLEHRPMPRVEDRQPTLQVPQVDVMVLYTKAAARQAAGKINGEICLAVSRMAKSLNKSEVKAKIRLVHHAEWDYNETASTANTALGKLTSILDDIGAQDKIKALRREHGADLVSFWVSDRVGKGKTCGAAYTTLAFPNPDNAYSVVLLSCANAEYSFAHELGHLLGANHDRFADEVRESTRDNWGYVKADKGWRTIMAYNRSDCLRAFCDRLNYWSNPDVLHKGDATGRSIDEPRADCTSADPSACDGPANNKHTLDMAAPHVADYMEPANALGNVSCE
jgi:Metallo-peptidase family M12